MLKLKINLLSIFLVCFITVNAQIKDYQFKREISGVNTIWNSFKLPDQLYKNVNNSFNDFRIFGVNGKDTIEVPYLLKQRADQIISKEITFKQINQSNNTDGYYFTFQSDQINTINQINLLFKEVNFDWKVTLEGSADNTKWFQILNNYRILSIKNNDTDYQFSRLIFPDSRYQYFRLKIVNNIQPVLLEARISKTDTIKGKYQEIKYKTFNLSNNPKARETAIDVTLERPMPISSLKLNVQSNFDYYRPVKIEYVTDSFKTEKGLQYNYSVLYEGTISSFEKSEFNFPGTIASQLRITIQNKDNKPLQISGAELKGSIYEIVGRFDDPKLSYALYYGNKEVNAPEYDLQKFESRIPSSLNTAVIGKELKNPVYTIKTERPLFENKAWLWVLMAVIVASLGWFSFKMLRN